MFNTIYPSVPGGGSCQGDVCPDTWCGTSPYDWKWCFHDGGRPAEAVKGRPVGGPSWGVAGDKVCPGRTTGDFSAIQAPFSLLFFLSSCHFWGHSYYAVHQSWPPCVGLFVSQDLMSVLLPRVLPAIIVGLQDLDDDVRAVAAAALIPVVEGLVQLLPSKVREGRVLPFYQ